MTRSRPPAPLPPAGLNAVSANDWLHSWRHVRVQPQVDVPAWDGSGLVRVTASVKSVGMFAATFATYETGADVHPGLAVLSQVAGYSERATGIALDAACRLGFLWRYVNGSQAGRPGSGRRPMASAYRLTVPDDILSGRVPLLDMEYRASDHPNSDQVMPDQVISDPGSPELSDGITRSEFAPPIHDPDIHPDITVVPLSATSVEGKPEPVGDQENSVRVITPVPLAAVQPPEDQACRYSGCRRTAAPVDGDGYHENCRRFAKIKGEISDSPTQARPEAS